MPSPKEYAARKYAELLGGSYYPAPDPEENEPIQRKPQAVSAPALAPEPDTLTPADTANPTPTETPTPTKPPNPRGGPRTEEGKRRSCLNALRHGLTGRTVVMPVEDLDIYNAFANEYVSFLNPQTPVERQFAQSAADSQWRINRIKSIEDGMLALGEFEPIPGDTGVEPVNIVLGNAQTFREHSYSFVNLSIYEQRLHRTQKEALRQLEELQTKREAKRQTTMDEAIRLKNFDEMCSQPHNPAADGFVYSSSEIGHEHTRRTRFFNAEFAQKCDFDSKTYFAKITQIPKAA